VTNHVEVVLAPSNHPTIEIGYAYSLAFEAGLDQYSAEGVDDAGRQYGALEGVCPRRACIR